MGADLIYTNPTEVIIPAGSTAEKPFDITIVDDNTPESVECLMLAIERVSTNALVGEVMEHTVFILDNDSCNPIINGLDPSYCIDSALVNLGGMPAGGTFSGSGVVGSVFDPVVAGTGVHQVVYDIAGPGCTTSATQNVTVNPSGACASASATLTLKRADIEAHGIRLLNQDETLFLFKEEEVHYDPLMKNATFDLPSGTYFLKLNKRGDEVLLRLDL